MNAVGCRGWQWIDIRAMQCFCLYMKPSRHRVLSPTLNATLIYCIIFILGTRRRTDVDRMTRTVVAIAYHGGCGVRIDIGAKSSEQIHGKDPSPQRHNRNLIECIKLAHLTHVTPSICPNASKINPESSLTPPSRYLKDTHFKWALPVHTFWLIVRVQVSPAIYSR
jgi:hypothetical protein